MAHQTTNSYTIQLRLQYVLLSLKKCKWYSAYLMKHTTCAVMFSKTLIRYAWIITLYQWMLYSLNLNAIFCLSNGIHICFICLLLLKGKKVQITIYVFYLYFKLWSALENKLMHALHTINLTFFFLREGVNEGVLINTRVEQNYETNSNLNR